MANVGNLSVSISLVSPKYYSLRVRIAKWLLRLAKALVDCEIEIEVNG